MHHSVRIPGSMHMDAFSPMSPNMRTNQFTQGGFLIGLGQHMDSTFGQSKLFGWQFPQAAGSIQQLFFGFSGGNDGGVARDNGHTRSQ